MNRFRERALTFVLAAGLAVGPGLAGRALAQNPPTGSEPAQPAPQAQPQPPTPPMPETNPAPTPAPAPPAGTPAPAPAPTPGGTGMAAFGFSFTAPAGWTQATDTSTITVPGEVCCAWSPDGTSTLTIFRQKPPKPVNPRGFLNASVKAFQTSLGATADQQEVRDVAGMRAMWMVVTGKGNGAAIDGKGTVPTSQHWVVIPRSTDVLIFLLTAPQEKFATYEAALQQALGTLQVSGTQTAAQKAAK